MTRNFVLLATLVLLAVAAVGIWAVLPPSIFSWAYWQEGGTASRSEIVRNLGLLAAGVIGVAFGIWRAVTAYHQTKASQEQADAANAQAHTSEQGHITERFSRAVEQLGHDRVAVRIGGLYALKRIAEDSVERDHLVVMDVLTNFIRQPPYADAQREVAERKKAWGAFQATSLAERPEEPPPKPELIDCPDIVAALEIIQGRSALQKAVEGPVYRPSLTTASLSYLRLPEIDLRYFDLASANLTGADLAGAKLIGANLTFADLTNTFLHSADLAGADLRRADLAGANLTDAILTGADFTSASLLEADLPGADLTSAELRDAYLPRANLTATNFMGAHLLDANLTDADLTLASNLTQEQLDSACISRGGEPPALPEGKGLKPPQNFCGP